MLTRFTSRGVDHVPRKSDPVLSYRLRLCSDRLVTLHDSRNLGVSRARGCLDLPVRRDASIHPVALVRPGHLLPASTWRTFFNSTVGVYGFCKNETSA